MTNFLQSAYDHSTTAAWHLMSYFAPNDLHDRQQRMDMTMQIIGEQHCAKALQYVDSAELEEKLCQRGWQRESSRFDLSTRATRVRDGLCEDAVKMVESITEQNCNATRPFVTEEVGDLLCEHFESDAQSTFNEMMVGPEDYLSCDPMPHLLSGEQLAAAPTPTTVIITAFLAWWMGRRG